jgi:hypothetical protein
MPFCPRCGKEVLVTDVYCPNCGQNVDRSVGGYISPQPATPASGPTGQPAPAHAKNPRAAALLNFFLPGIGYLYIGIGRDLGELVFGAVVFVAYVIGIDATVVGGILSYSPTSSSGPASPYDFLANLVFLLPFAFAYDGYRRAKRAGP